MSETFNDARRRIIAELTALGWTVVGHLKIPHATSPDYGDKALRFWFKPQAIWYSAGSVVKDFKFARSVYIDIRDRPATDIIATVRKYT